MSRKVACVLGFLLLGMVFSARAIPAQQLKIGYVDVERLKNEFKDFKDAQEKFNRQLTKWQSHADTLLNQIKVLQEDLDRQSSLLTEAKRQEKQQLIILKQKEYQEFATNILGPEGEAARRERELSKPLIDKINAVIQLVAIRDGYSLILDTSGGDVLYAKEEMDITNEILAQLNK
ncbi:MAG: OmpH family outer membrane protein [candidate division Zixibacteria bacterium]|nr:OmpH family outer membrane protein [candidate division Zixibacteria bacterium]